MTSTTHPGSHPRPPSPWTGSHHIAQHRWQLDHVVSLPEVVDVLTDLAAELTDAHHAGWWLAEPLRGGQLVAARASRRERGRGTVGLAATAPERFVRPGPWRLRAVDEVPVPGLAVFDSGSAPLTPVLAWTGRSLEQVSGPAVPATDVAEAVRQVTPTGLPTGCGAWPGRTSGPTSTSWLTEVGCGRTRSVTESCSAPGRP
ncbi:hypothetical protein [Nocardioides ungokensis]|uniref:hypothetical protein n=1 Tax=Nocardioides ungokensis TaxID=1643322 RepID=UPI0015E05CA1|nr:hypothetical protein [Nocardioides ungokensis]